MSNPYIGEIRLFAGNFAPAGWAFCDGQLMAISENDALFTLLGTTYGGDGQDTFGIPDLRGRVPMHVGNSHIQGEMAGTDEVTLTIQQIPSHTHPLLATQHPGSTNVPSATTVIADEGPAGITQILTYKQSNANQLPLNPAIVTLTGGSQPHNNIQRTVCVNYIISLFGVFPTQT